jgi:hypothetical protein
VGVVEVADGFGVDEERFVCIVSSSFRASAALKRSLPFKYLLYKKFPAIKSTTRRMSFFIVSKVKIISEPVTVSKYHTII